MRISIAAQVLFFFLIIEFILIFICIIYINSMNDNTRDVYTVFNKIFFNEKQLYEIIQNKVLSIFLERVLLFVKSAEVTT